MSKIEGGVGRSSRTPVKHGILRRSFGKVLGVAALCHPNVPCRISRAEPFLAVDLCGGDGLQTDGHDASPKIMHQIASKTRARGHCVYLTVIEKQRNTYDALKQNCQEIDAEPWCTLELGDAREFVLPRMRSKQGAFIHCDPNNVDQTPLTGPLVDSFNEATTYLVTLGCNVGGLKRKKLEERQPWFDHVDRLVRVLPNRHDAILFWLNSDAAQWAYLLSTPRVWAKRDASSIAVETSKKWTHGVEWRSLRTDKVKFYRELRRLFLTKTEFDNV
jgi:hypothetical protein